MRASLPWRASPSNTRYLADWWANKTFRGKDPVTGHIALRTSGRVSVSDSWTREYQWLGLFVLSPNAAVQWSGSTEQLQAQNRIILAGDPSLCKSILRAGEKSGKAAFVIAHALALLPVVGILRDDYQASRKNRPAKVKKTKSAPAPVTEPPYDVVTEPNGNTSPGMSFFE